MCLGSGWAWGRCDDVMDLVPLSLKGLGDMQVEVSRRSGVLSEEEPGDRYLGASEPLLRVRSSRESVSHEKCFKFGTDLGSTYI